MKSLDPKLPTIGKILRKLGYYTAYKGKWHLNGAMAVENRPDDIKALFESTMDKDYGFYDYTGTGDYIEGALGGYQYDAITSAQAAQWLKAKGRPMTDRKQPWYLAVNLVNPHDVMWLNTDLPGQPVQAKDAQLKIAGVPADTLYQQEWTSVPVQNTWQQPLDAPGRVAAHRLYHEANGYLTGLIPNDEWRVRKRQDYYFNCIRDVDQQVVQILDQLDRLGLTDKTIVIFTSDHGELLGSHGGLSGKGTTAYSQQNHVPMLIVHPAFPGPQRCRETTSHLDIVPDHRRHDRQVDDARGRHHGAHEGQGPDAAAATAGQSGLHPGARRRAVLLQPAHGARPGLHKFLYETLHNKQIAKADHLRAIELFPSTGRCASPSARSPTSAIASRATSPSAPSTRRRPWTISAPRTISSSTTCATIPTRSVNLAYDFDANRDLIASMNTKLNALIAAEIGVDDGSFLPFKDFVDWGTGGQRQSLTERGPPGPLMLGARLRGAHALLTEAPDRSRRLLLHRRRVGVAAAQHLAERRRHRALAAGVDPDRRGHAGAQRRLAGLRRQAQLHRQALHDLDPVARGVLRRQHGELRARRRAQSSRPRPPRSCRDRCRAPPWPSGRPARA